MKEADMGIHCHESRTMGIDRQHPEAHTAKIHALYRDIVTDLQLVNTPHEMPAALAERDRFRIQELTAGRDGSRRICKE